MNNIANNNIVKPPYIKYTNIYLINSIICWNTNISFTNQYYIQFFPM